MSISKQTIVECDDVSDGWHCAGNFPVNTNNQDVARNAAAESGWTRDSWGRDFCQSCTRERANNDCALLDGSEEGEDEAAVTGD